MVQMHTYLQQTLCQLSCAGKICMLRSAPVSVSFCSVDETFSSVSSMQILPSWSARRIAGSTSPAYAKPNPATVTAQRTQRKEQRQPHSHEDLVQPSTAKRPEGTLLFGWSKATLLLSKGLQWSYALHNLQQSALSSTAMQKQDMGNKQCQAHLPLIPVSVSSGSQDRHYMPSLHLGSRP